MSREQILLWLVIAPPFLGSAALPFIGRTSEGLRNAAALALVALALLCDVMLIPAVANHQAVSLQLAGFVWFHADMLAVFMALVSLLVGTIIVFYSFGYISHYPFRGEYYFMVVLFLGAMMGLVFSANLILLFVFWEVTALACWRLIGFFRREPCVARADKAFLITVFGALAMLLGFIALYAQSGSFDYAALHNYFLGRPLPALAVIKYTRLYIHRLPGV